MRLLKVSVVCLMLFGSTAVMSSPIPASLVEGSVVGLKNATVTLFRNIGGIQQRFAETSLTIANNHFCFAFPVSVDGEFVKLIISDFDKEGTKEKNRVNYHVELFVKHRNDLDIRIQLQKPVVQPFLPVCTLVGSSPENTILLGWQKLYDQFRAAFHDADPAARVKKFTSVYGQYRQKLTGYVSGVSCKSNPAFEIAFREGAMARLKFAPLEYFTANQSNVDNADPVPAYNKLMSRAYDDLQAYCGDALFRMEGIVNLKRYYQLLYRARSTAAGLKVGSNLPDDSVKALICNKKVKGYYGARSDWKISMVDDTSRSIGFPAKAYNTDLAFIRVKLEGFSIASEFRVTAFEDVVNRSLISVKINDNYLVVPVWLRGEVLVSFDVYDLKAKLLLKPGDSVDLHVYNASGDPSGKKIQARYAVKSGTVENRILASWYAYAYPVTRNLQASIAQAKVLPGEQFEQDYNKVYAGVDRFVADSAVLGNAAFQQMFRALSHFDLRLSALMFLAKMQNPYGYSGPFFKGFNVEKMSAFFSQFSDGNILCEPGIYRFPDANLLVNYISKLQWAMKPATEKDGLPVGAALGYQLAQLCTPQAKSCLLAWQMMANEIATNWREVKLNCLPNKDLFVTDEMKANYSRLVQAFAADTLFIGKPVINAPFFDTSGHSIHLSDFKGKVVFIDVWATWCAPCREQIPYLLKIEEEYRNNPDMVFVGLSVDREKDREKWKKFIASEKLQGTQLIDYSGKVFQTKYQIPAIPRFILIDKKGNISEMRCPYPVNSRELKAYLNELLDSPAM